MCDASGARFCSILFDGDSPYTEAVAQDADFFHDLNLDQIVAAITKGRQEYNLHPFFSTGPVTCKTIAYRQEVMRDLENGALLDDIKRFAEHMRVVRSNLDVAERQRHKHSSERWFLDAVDAYCGAVKELLDNLHRAGPESSGLRAFQNYLALHVRSGAFTALVQQVYELKSALLAIRYCILVRDGSVTVLEYNQSEDYSAVIESTFAKFRQGAVTDYRVKLGPSTGMNHVEAEILDRVAKRNPQTFRALGEFTAKNAGFVDKQIAAFDREIQFYVAYLEYVQSFKRTGLSFCYPQVSDTHKDVNSRNSFDLALAARLIGEGTVVVCNDFSLSRNERILVVTGPNQGGKTTFARLYGQVHYLANLGCPVPGTEARLFHFDRIHTHFEREETLQTLRGKLQDDLVRIHRILTEATPRSVIIMNEIFSSTTVKDGILLGRNILDRLSQLDALCVCVTFLDELAAMNDKVVSVVAAVAPKSPDLRTYRIERRPADGLAYALALAKKHRLTYECLKDRIQP